MRFQHLRFSVWGAIGMAVFFILPATDARAQHVGFQAGVSVDPDQFYLGAHVETAPLVNRLHFRPNLEAGFGDNKTTITGNFEFIYEFPLPKSEWMIYPGAGPAIVITSVDGRNRHDTEAGGGFNIVFGLAHRRGFFAEFKVGAIDSPNLKFGIGYTFR